MLKSLKGQLLPIFQNNALFALISTLYGGDGVSTFGFPDLRERLVIRRDQRTRAHQNMGLVQHCSLFRRGNRHALLPPAFGPRPLENKV